MRMERAIAISEKHFGRDHPKLAIYYSNLAMILNDLGDLPGARTRLERAIWPLQTDVTYPPSREQPLALSSQVSK